MIPAISFSDNITNREDVPPCIAKDGTSAWNDRLARAHQLTSGSTALIADDDEFFRLALRVILIEKLGFAEVIEASSLDEALSQLCNNTDVKLAIFDLGMPGVDSAKCLRRVREKFSDLKTVVISGSRSRNDVLSALSSGVNGYLPKSLGAAKIFQALVRVLDGVIYVPDLITALKPDEKAKPEIAKKYVLGDLTPRQKEVLLLLVQGKSNKEIARNLELGEGTVKVHVGSLFRTLGTNNRLSAAVMGAQLMAQ